MQQQRLNKKSLGFTLVEMMVAVSIFSVVALVITGAVITANEVNRKAQSIKLAIDNLNFALENMSLKIRQGKDFYCLQNYDEAVDIASGLDINPGDNKPTCTNTSVGIAFEYPDPDPLALPGDTVNVVYAFYDGGLPTEQSIRYWIGGTSNDQLIPITNVVDVNIVAAKFSLWNQPQPGDTAPVGRPRILISLRGRTHDAKNPTEFYLQTVASEQ